MDHSHPDALYYGNIAGLIRNLSDPEEIVRIASMRAIVRVAAMADSSVREEIYLNADPELSHYRRKDIIRATFVPEPRIMREISNILGSSDEQDRERARLVLIRTAEIVESDRSMAEEAPRPQREREANELITNVIRNWNDA